MQTRALQACTYSRHRLSNTAGCHHVVPHTQPLRTPNVVHLSVRLRSMLGLSRGRRWFRMTLSLGRHVFGTGELSCSAPSRSSLELVESGPEAEASQSAKHGSTWSRDTTDALVHMTVCLFFLFFFMYASLLGKNKTKCAIS